MSDLYELLIEAEMESKFQSILFLKHAAKVNDTPVDIDFKNYDRVVCGFSGGKDSVAAVLHLLDCGVDSSNLHVALIKSFGSEEECQAIASAISGALDSMTFYDEIPQIVSMAELIPPATWWERVTSFARTVYIESNLTEITVRAENEMLYHQNFQLIQPVN